MKCINCGVNLNDGTSFCIRCGSYQNDNQVPTDKKSENVKIKRDINYDILEKVYVGKKYNSFIYSGFSWLCFFVGPLYTLSRKMYLFSIVYFFVSLIVTSLAGLVNEWFQIVSIIVINWFFAYKFKKSYLDKVKFRVNKIVMDNPNLDMVMLQEKCRKQGGLNWFFVVLGILSGLLVIVALVLLIYLSIGNDFNLIKNKTYYQSEINDICTRTKNNALFISSQEFKIGEVYNLNSIIGLENYEGEFTIDKDNNINLINIKIKEQICNGICPFDIKCK